jgi:DNA primase
MIDNMETCPKCKCDACYTFNINETKKSYHCFGCGYYTTDLLVEGEYDKETYEETYPELHKDLMYVDEDKRCWYPQTINHENGTVFMNGPNKENAVWSAIRKTELTKEEKQMPRYKNQTHKSDAKTLKSFDKDFIEALDYIGFFSNLK